MFSFTSFKIVCGYVLLAVLFVFSARYISKEMHWLSASPDYLEEIGGRRHLTHQVVTKVYDADLVGLSICSGKEDDYPKYQQYLREAECSLDSLLAYKLDASALARVDTVRTLLHQKDENMKEVLEVMGGKDLSDYYHKQLEDLLKRQRALIDDARLRKQVETKEENYVTHHKKKKFFKRLAEAFVPGKGDSTEVQTVVHKEVSDSLIEAYNPIDTIALVLDDVQAKIKQMQKANKAALYERVRELQMVGMLLNQRINQALENIEQDEHYLAGAKKNWDYSVRSRVAKTIEYIAIIAVLLAIVFLVVIIHDLIRLRRYQRDLKRSKLYAEDLLVMRERLMLTITHDIKAPVGSIIGYVDLLIRLVQEKRQLFYLQNMKSSARHLLDLVSSLLDYHRLESGKLDLHPVAFNPSELFQDIYISFLPIAKKKNLRLKYNDGLERSCSVKGDPFRIRQIVENLLSNALKFTEKGEIVLTASYADGKLSFSVKDSGCGISKEDQDKIFSAFTRLQSAHGQEGFGLGLSITKKLVSLLSGTMGVESELGQGSTFSVALPLEEADPSECLSNEHIRLTSDKPLRIVLIDDDRIQLDLTKAIIYGLFEGAENVSAPVIQYCTPTEFFELIRQQQHFDILFTDIQMPEMNGFELLKHLRNIDSPLAHTIPVVAITARGDMSDDEFKAEGFAGRLSKPFKQDDFAKILLNLPGVKRNTSVEPLPAEVKQVADEQEFDFSALTAFSSGDEEAAKAILTTFAEETQKNVEKMKTALQQKDMQTLCGVAHKMLPTFTMIKANRAIPALQWLEKRRQDNIFTKEAAERAEIILQEAEKIMIKVSK